MIFPVKTEHHKNIAEITNAGTAQMCMREPYDVITAVMIAAAPIPSAFNIGGAKLHCAKGHVCATYKNVAMSG